MTFYESTHQNTADLVFEGKANTGKRIIIDAAELTPGRVEVMAMLPSGRELDCISCSLEDAPKEFNRLLNKYTRPLADSESKPLTGKYAKLATDLLIALVHGVKAEDANPEDGGTCNFDSPMLYLPRWNEALVKRAAEEAGTHVFASTVFGHKCFIVSCKSGAQANARTRNAEAVCAALKKMGYDCSMYYQMD